MKQVGINQERQILYYYSRGVASYLIAKKMGVSNTKVRSVLVKHGVRLRTHSITNKLSAQKRTPEQNKAITQKATEKNIGGSHSSLHRARLAVSRQNNPTIDPVYELPMVELCKKLGIGVVPQKAFYKYNVDLYLPINNVVIEVFGGGFHNKTEAVDMFSNKMKYLSSKNVPVLVVWADKSFDPQAVLEVALRVSEMLTIVDGTGAPTTRGYSLMISR
jgi:hypothetical protein